MSDFMDLFGIATPAEYSNDIAQYRCEECGLRACLPADWLCQECRSLKAVKEEKYG